MAAAIPAAIGVGGSIISGIQGKGAAKKQEKMAREQWQAILPMLQAQGQATQEALGMARGIIPQAQNAINTVFNQATGTFEPLMKDYRSMLAEATSGQSKFNEQGEALRKMGLETMTSALPHLMGASSALEDLRQAYRPFLHGGQMAMDRFLPKQKQLQEFLAGDIANINQGAKTASQNINDFAGKGGRVSSQSQVDLDRQRQINEAYSKGKQSLFQTNLQGFFQGAEGTQNVANSLQQLGFGKGQLGLGQIGAGQQDKALGIQEFGSKANVGLNQLQSALQSLGLAGGAAGNLGQLGGGILGAGLSGGQQATSLYNAQANRAYGAGPNVNTSEGLGSHLVKLFSNPGAQDWMKGIFGGGKGPGTMPSQKTPG